MVNPAGRLPAAKELRCWRWPALFVLISVLGAMLFPARQPLAPAQNLLADSSPWVTSAGMHGAYGSQQTRWRSATTGPFTASRTIALPRNTEFIRLRVCLAEPAVEESAALMLASVRAEGVLDFNRRYRLWGVSGAQRGECIEEEMPRRDGDSHAVAQIQLLTGNTQLSLSELSATPLRVTTAWRYVQPAMLLLGIALLLLPFRAYFGRRPRLIAVAGVMTVAGIVFGCTVSVSLKADIYALLTGGRNAAVTQIPLPLAELLLQVFPASGGFSIFTHMHALLFATGTLLLSFVHRRAWLDMLLLAPVSETLQIFVPGRGPGVSDMLVDWEGVLAAWLLVSLLRRSHRVRLFLEQQGIDKDITRL